MMGLALGQPEQASSQTEREEALWCEVVRLRYRLQQMEQEAALLREHIDLLKARDGAVSRTGSPERTPTVARQRRAPSKRLRPEETEQIIGLLAQGVAQRDLVAQFGVSREAIQMIRSRNKHRIEVIKETT